MKMDVKRFGYCTSTGMGMMRGAALRTAQAGWLADCRAGAARIVGSQLLSTDLSRRVDSNQLGVLVAAIRNYDSQQASEIEICMQYKTQYNNHKLFSQYNNKH